MDRLDFSIGGLLLRMEGEARQLAAVLDIPGFDCFLARFDTPDILFRFDDSLSLPPSVTLARSVALDGEVECRFGRTADGCYTYSLGPGAALLFNPAEPGVVRLMCAGGLARLRFLLWLAYSLVGLGRRRIPVHSSAVVYQGRAVAVLGESGTGKSTHTRLWLDHIPATHRLNDDSPILAVLPDGVWLYGSPWSGKGACFRQERYPLAALVRLEQRPENVIRRLSSIESFVALMPSCPPTLQRDEAATDLLVSTLSLVIPATPVFRLGCRPDAEAAQLCHHAVYERQ